MGSVSVLGTFPKIVALEDPPPLPLLCRAKEHSEYITIRFAPPVTTNRATTARGVTLSHRPTGIPIEVGSARCNGRSTRARPGANAATSRGGPCVKDGSRRGGPEIRGDCSEGQ